MAAVRENKEDDRWCFIADGIHGNAPRVSLVVGEDSAFHGPTTQRTSVPANLIVLCERVTAGTNWTEPGGDITVRMLEDWCRRGRLREHVGLGDDGFYVGFADGTYQKLSFLIPIERLRNHIRLSAVGNAKQSDLDLYSIERRKTAGVFGLPRPQPSTLVGDVLNLCWSAFEER
jgi:hypothetical protein